MTGVQTCALPISTRPRRKGAPAEAAPTMLVVTSAREGEEGAELGRSWEGRWVVAGGEKSGRAARGEDRGVSFDLDPGGRGKWLGLAVPERWGSL